ncbi:DUF3329 domain-containing protein [Propionispira raffinosivorans]|uniref:DUF3329 domain-containing protein n=1 Tax=Propionispira raffinosivorans TaxID=86959 RepID=UPI00035D3CF4|nr:DUF6056 family protein [Propionispira raffinosivorans]
MEKCKKITNENWASGGILASLFIYMFALNFLMPLHRDDYEYSLIWGTLQKITTMSDVFQSLYFHYLIHGGRMVDFFVLDTFLLWGKQWFNPFNAFLFVALIVLIYWHSQQQITLRFNPYILALIIMFCWFGLPDFALVNIWMTGACVYLLTAVLIFAFLLPYHFDFLGKPIIDNGLMGLLGMFFCGIIASWTIENTAATMNLVIAVLVVYAYKKERLKKWMLSGFVGSVIGFLLLAMAPGNYVRYAAQKTPLMQHIVNQFGGGFEMLLGLLPAIVFLVLACRIVLVGNRKIVRTESKEVEKESKKFIIASTVRMILVGLMLLSKMKGSFISLWISELLYENVVVRIGIVDEHLNEQLFTTLSGVEEVLIYLLIGIQLSKYIFRKWKLGKAYFKNVSWKAQGSGLLTVHPNSYHVMILLTLAVVNNFVMLAAPAFPGRAGFGSAVFFIIGVMTVFRIPQVKKFLLSTEHKNTLTVIVMLSVIPMAAAVLYQHAVLYTENSQRMALVEKQVAQGSSSLVMEPVSLKNEILRHVYFVDLNNAISKYGFCRYYHVNDVKVLSVRTPNR